MRKKTILSLLILILFLLAGCKSNITCNKPYILVGTECCLDLNDNSICDSDEEIEEEPETEYEFICGSGYAVGNDCNRGLTILEQEYNEINESKYSGEFLITMKNNNPRECKMWCQISFVKDGEADMFLQGQETTEDSISFETGETKTLLIKTTSGEIYLACKEWMASNCDTLIPQDFKSILKE